MERASKGDVNAPDYPNPKDQNRLMLKELLKSNMEVFCFCFKRDDQKLQESSDVMCKHRNRNKKSRQLG